MEIREDDYGLDINFTIYESDGTTARDLSGIDTIHFLVRDNSTGRNILDGTCTVVSAVAGTCKYTIQDNDLTKDGSYTAGIQLRTTSPAKVETSKDFSLIVKDSLK